MTIVMVGILASVSGSIFFGRQAFDARGYFEETVSALRYAQKLAIATNCPVRVTLGAAGYALFQPTAVCPPSPAVAPDFAANVISPVGGAAFTKVPPSNVVVASSLAQFFFCPQGHVASVAANCPTGIVVGANITGSVDTHNFTVIPGGGYVQTP